MEPLTEPLEDEHKAAEFLDHGVQTLRNWRSKGCGPRYVKIGRSVRYRPEDLRKFINDRVIDPK
jgi:hypothetical protein